jgi:hypothetical protein
VKIICRRKMRIQPFDVSHKWVGPDRNKYMAEFWTETDLKKRRAMLQQAKKPDIYESHCAATVTREGMALIEDGLKLGTVQILEQIEVSRAKWTSNNAWRVVLTDNSVETPSLIW